MNSAASCPDPTHQPYATLFLAPEAGTEMRRRARRAYPQECCGFLLGTSGKVAAIRPAPNSLSGDRRFGFHIDAAEVRDAWLSARRQNMDILGTYHSHPGGDVRPSEQDRQSGWELQVIASIAPPFATHDGDVLSIHLNAWRTRLAEIREVKLVEGDAS